MTISDDSVARGMAFLRESHPEGASALEAALGERAPDLLRMAASVAFDHLYHRDGLAKRERQIATLATLATAGALPQFKIHVGVARGLGLSRREILEICLQIAPYAGFPAAINATLAALEVLESGGAAA